MTNHNEIFRFAVARGVQRASPKSVKGKLILCDDGNDEIGVRSHMPAPIPRPSQEQAVAAAQAFYDSDEMVRGLGDLMSPIAALDGWLLDRGDTIGPARLRSEILSIWSAANLTVLLSDSQYIADRRRLSASLTASVLAPQGNIRLRTILVRGMYLFGLIEELASSPSVLQTPKDVFAFLAFATIILPRWFPIPGEALSRPPAIADLKVVRQEVVRYERGDIAHIENVLKKESKSRVHRRKDIRDETLTTESERETSEERELQTAERFELQQEASSVIKDDSHVEAGMTLTASYGPTVSATANAGFEMNHSKEEARRTASNFAREVMERSASRVRERTRSERVVRTISEMEETNTHGVDNSDGEGHVIGIYRYVDKVYRAQIYNYGARLLLEFIVPEPASFIRQVMERPLAVDMEPPAKPVVAVTGSADRPLRPGDITRTSYLEWAAKYYVSDITPPPAEELWMPLAWDEPARPDTGITPETPARKIYKTNQSLDVPAGYVAKQVRGILGVSDYQENIVLSVGETAFTLSAAAPAGGTGAYSLAFRFDQPLGTFPSGKVPIGLVIENCWGYEITLLVKCDLTTEGFEKWQLATYAQIMRAYFELKSLYEQKVSAAEIQRGVGMDGRNPLENRTIERVELKKQVIAMLERSYFTKSPMDQDPVTYAPPGSSAYHEINFAVAQKERNYIQWFEQAFEWQNLTYVFYPYYWGHQANWREDALGRDTDPLFNHFLRAGAARVVVPVRPGFEKAMGLYLATGIIWSGNQVPQVGDPLFVSAIEEIQEQQGGESEGTPEGPAWEFRLPTPLVILQEDGVL